MRHGRFSLVFGTSDIYTAHNNRSIPALQNIRLVSNKRLNKVLIFVGSISLEIYLLHNHFILIYIEQLRWHYWSKFFATLVIVLPFAWLLHKGVEKLTMIIKKELRL